jgi:hypothetical protein
MARGTERHKERHDCYTEVIHYAIQQRKHNPLSHISVLPFKLLENMSLLFGKHFVSEKESLGEFF